MTNEANRRAWSAGSTDGRHGGSATELQELLTVDELAALLKVSKSWVYEHTRSPRLPRAESLPDVKIGKYVRFNAAAHPGIPVETVSGHLIACHKQPLQ
jgi:excisionase family DNA binding protein